MTAIAAVSAAGVRQGLTVFLAGRALSGLLGVAWLALLVRNLPTPELAVHFALLAVFEITQLASGCGVQAYIQRFVPVDLMQCSGRTLGRRLLGLVGWRLATLVLASAFIAGLWPWLPGWTGQRLSGIPLVLFLAFLCCEGLLRCIELLLESLLLQGRRQGLALARNLMRMAGLGLLITAGAAIDAALVLRLELGLSAALAVAGLWFIARYLRERPEPRHPAAEPPAARGPRLRFALQGHAALLLGLVAGVDMLKLVVGATAGPAALATFGVAVALADMAARHLPALLLFDYVRAVLTARTSPHGGGPLPWLWPRLLLRLNGLVLIALLAWMLVFGEAARQQLASGPSPAGLVACIATLLPMLFVQAFRLMAGLVAHLQSDNRSVLWATMATWCAPPLVALAAPHLGAPAGALGLLVVELSYAWVLKQRLSLHLTDLLGDLRFWRRAGAAGGAAAACGLAASLLHHPTWALGAGSALLLACYAGLLWRLRPLAPDEHQALWRLAGRA